MTSISPFTFMTWKEDDGALVVGTANTHLGYMELLTIDGINASDIIAYAEEQCGTEKWSNDIATSFPEYVAALAAKAGTPCFVTTKTANVEYADLSTGEVLEAEFPASEEAYNEAVRVEKARAEHNMPSGHNDGEDDEYESVDEEDDHEDHDDPKRQAYMRKRQFIDMIATQMETAMSIAGDFDLTLDDMKHCFKAAVGNHHVPETSEECAAIAEKDEALSSYLASHTQSGAGAGAGPGGRQCEQQ